MNSNQKLKFVLRANAGFSSFSGIVLIFFHTSLAKMMNITVPEILLFLGIGLLLFAGALLWTAARPQLSPLQVKSIIIQDWLWVLGSGLIIGLQAFGISEVGYIIIAIVALIVADFAILQNRYLKQSRS